MQSSKTTANNVGRVNRTNAEIEAQIFKKPLIEKGTSWPNNANDHPNNVSNGQVRNSRKSQASQEEKNIFSQRLIPEGVDWDNANNNVETVQESPNNQPTNGRMVKNANGRIQANAQVSPNNANDHPNNVLNGNITNVNRQTNAQASLANIVNDKSADVIVQNNGQVTNEPPKKQAKKDKKWKSNHVASKGDVINGVWKTQKVEITSGYVKSSELRVATEKALSEGLRSFAPACFEAFFREDELINRKFKSVTLMKGTNALSEFTRTNTPALFEYLEKVLHIESTDESSNAIEFLKEHLGHVLFNTGDVDLMKLLPYKVNKNIRQISKFMEKEGIKDLDHAMTNLLHSVHNRLLETDGKGVLILDKLKSYVEARLAEVLGKEYEVKIMNSHHIKIEQFEDYVLISTNQNPKLNGYSFECNNVNMHKIAENAGKYDRNSDINKRWTKPCFPVRNSINLSHIEFDNALTNTHSHFALLRNAMVLQVRHGDNKSNTIACNFLDVSIPLGNDSAYHKKYDITEKINELRNTMTVSTGSLKGSPLPTLAYLIEDNAGQMANLIAEKDNAMIRNVSDEADMSSRKAIVDKIKRLQQRSHVMDIVMSYQYLGRIKEMQGNEGVIMQIVKILANKDKYSEMIANTLRAESNLYSNDEINMLVDVQVSVWKKSSSFVDALNTMLMSRGKMNVISSNAVINNKGEISDIWDISHPSAAAAAGGGKKMRSLTEKKKRA